MILVAMVALNVVFFTAVPKGLLPTQDNGVLLGAIQADQGISFQAMEREVRERADIVQRDSAVQNAASFTGAGAGRISGQTNTGNVFVLLKPRRERGPLDAITGRLRRPLSQVSGAMLILAPLGTPAQTPGRPAGPANIPCRSGDAAEIEAWTPRLVETLRHEPVLADVGSDVQVSGRKAQVEIDRATASRLGLSVQQISNTLYDAFGQRPVSTIYKPLNQYRVVMEVAPQYWQDPDVLGQIWVSTSGGTPSGTATTGAPSGTVANGTASSATNGRNDSQRNASQNALAASGSNGASAAPGGLGHRGHRQVGAVPHPHRHDEFHPIIERRRQGPHKVVEPSTFEPKLANLASLTGVENLRPALLGERLFDRVEAELDLQRDRDAPGEHPPAEPAQHGCWHPAKTPHKDPKRAPTPCHAQCNGKPAATIKHRFLS